MTHPLARALMQRQRDLSARRRCLLGTARGSTGQRGVLSVWHVQIHGGKGQYHQRIVTIGINDKGERSRLIERLAEGLRDLSVAHDGLFDPDQRTRLVRAVIPDMVRRDLAHNGLLADGASLSNRLLVWVELV
jgi:hypothetical protein